jgi:predicted secreted protein
MSLVTGIATYFMIWWLVIFITLPFGVERDPSPQQGHMNGAPRHHKMKEKFIATSIISIFIWIVVFVIMKMDLIDFYGTAEEMAREDGLL